MTKKNKQKTAARARKAALNGKYMHHWRISGGGESPPPAMAASDDVIVTMRSTIFTAEQSVPKGLSEAAARFDRPFVFVVVEGSDPVGANFAATRIAERTNTTREAALSEIFAEARRRRARNETCPYAEFMTVDDLGTLLHKIMSPTLVGVTVEIAATLSTPPDAGMVHVFALAEGQAVTTLVSAVRLCDCGHPRAEHADNGKGACTFLGIPDERAVYILPSELRAHARAAGTPMRCPCGGPLAHYDAHGRFIGSEQ